jgi:hypothetical protein
MKNLKTPKEAYDFLQWLIENGQCTIEQRRGPEGLVLSLGYPKKLNPYQEEHVFVASIMAMPEYIRREAKSQEDVAASAKSGESFEQALRRRFRK